MARKVMVVADPTRESAIALQYALSHAVVENDNLILLYVENSNSWMNRISLFKKSSPGPNINSVDAATSTFFNGMSGPWGGDPSEFLEEMKKACLKAQPNVNVTVEKVELGTKEKTSLILSNTAAHNVDTLIVGQRRSLADAILGQRRNGSFSRWLDTADFLIENSKCTCVAVQKKGQNGGYLLNTKTHKNFWLLA